MSVVRPFRLPAARLSLALALLAPRLPAQAALQEPAAAPVTAPAPTAPADSSAPATRGPTQEAARVGARLPVEREAPEANAPRRGGPGFGQAEALMIVGGAGVVVGLIVGGGAGGALALGSAVVGLVGLYQYLR